MHHARTVALPRAERVRERRELLRELARRRRGDGRLPERPNGEHGSDRGDGDQAEASNGDTWCIAVSSVVKPEKLSFLRT
jgi:hypothetical protein